jgi:hypothetical protein
MATTAEAREPVASQACRADVEKWCPGVPPGGGRLATCLRENQSRLADPCAAQLGKVEACATAVRKQCPGAEGEAALKACAREHRLALAPACRGVAG